MDTGEGCWFRVRRQSGSLWEEKNLKALRTWGENFKIFMWRQGNSLIPVGGPQII